VGSVWMWFGKGLDLVLSFGVIDPIDLGSI
jgi:hypothetical protein